MDILLSRFYDACSSMVLNRCEQYYFKYIDPIYTLELYLMLFLQTLQWDTQISIIMLYKFNTYNIKMDKTKNLRQNKHIFHQVN